MRRMIFAAVLMLFSALVSYAKEPVKVSAANEPVKVSAVNEPVKVSILGDSYSTYAEWVHPTWNICWYRPDSGRDNDVKRVEDTWWYRFIADNGYQLERNNSFSGSTICLTGYEGNDYSDRAFISRLFDLGQPDLIIVFGGTNDDWAGAPLGEFKYADRTKADLFSVRPAFAYLLENLQRYYPEAEIVNVTNSELSDEITRSLETICNKYGVVNVLLHDIDKQLSHPSVAGMKAISDQIQTAMKGNR